MTGPQSAPSTEPSPATPPPPAPPAPQGGSAMGAVMSGMWTGLLPGERLVVIGAALILVVGEWLLDALLAGHGLLVSTPIAAAQLLLFVFVMHSRRQMTWPIPYPVVLAALATVIAVPAVSGFLDTLRVVGDVGSLGAATLLGLLVEWVGAALVAVGAFQVWASKSS